ncbi:hypothetical protein PWT90_02594 [Aphanocladium album]|nr:hypothetical protein PWT90_02594 [Aphanocladium album]
MQSVPVLSLLLLASGALAGTIKYPEVIPGPGMPSLASLNLTSEQLYTMPMPDGPQFNQRSLVSRAYCAVRACTRAPRDDALACYNYLNNLGTTMCGGDGRGVVQFCYAGQAQITGGMDHASSSYCEHVAIGALDVINNCYSDRGVKGLSVAYGNGDINVGVNGLDCSTSD